MTAAMEKERADFEKWVCSLRKVEYAPFERRSDGQYFRIGEEDAWQSWLARASISPQVPEWVDASQPPPLHLEDEGDPTEISAPLLVLVDGNIRFGSCYRGVKSGRIKYQAQGHLGNFTVTHWMDVESLRALLPGGEK